MNNLDDATRTGLSPASEPASIRLPRANREAPDVERAQIVPGQRAGERRIRLPRQKERRFQPEGDGLFRATEQAIAPRSPWGRSWRRLRRVAVGSPLSTAEQEEQRLPKSKALAVFSSDALSSSAYATDEILIVLAAAGAGALVHSLELAVTIAILLAVVAFSYRQTIRAYPSGGGAYIVARENLGDAPGLVAASALAVDYILTVAVSIAAGVLAITSAFPEMREYRVELALGAIGLITLANLRGIRESGTLFAIPTYGFIICFATLIGVGLLRVFLDPSLEAEVPESAHELGTEGLGLFLLLRAFASGCTALTGIEAISNGVPAFKRPESQNASTTLAYMAIILSTFFICLTLLANQLHVHPADDVSVAAQIGRVVFGEGLLFYIIQAFTALILILAANTSYADFPRLASILARDRFLPHHFTFRGDRLAFSNGILVLGLAASVLVVAFGADVTRLIPLYAFGVFVSFTLSQAGMVQHWRRLRDAGWKHSAAINGAGAIATAVVATIVGLTKFASGSWISMIMICFLAVLFWLIHRHLSRIHYRLAIEDVSKRRSVVDRRQPVIVPVDDVNLATLKALDFARSVSDNATAIHITDDEDAGKLMKKRWYQLDLDIPLVVIDSPFRSLVAPFLSYLDALGDRHPEASVTVILPDFRTAFAWQRWMHNQSARRLQRALRNRPDVVLVEVPYQLG